MALTNAQKQVAALLAQRNTDADYMIKLSADPEFAQSEIMENIVSIKESLLKEKFSHESHKRDLDARLEKISSLLSCVEELQNGNE